MRNCGENNLRRAFGPVCLGMQDFSTKDAKMIVFLLLFGVAIGMASGLLGIGGGVLLVPGLVMLFGFSQAEAQGTSLSVLIPPIGIFAAMVYSALSDFSSCHMAIRSSRLKVLRIIRGSG